MDLHNDSEVRVLFSHVAGEQAAMDAWVSKLSNRSAFVRSAAQSLLQYGRSCPENISKPP
jgi:hypothetical protein